jgi:glycerol uptake facilitator-like aquaporin
LIFFVATLGAAANGGSGGQGILDALVSGLAATCIISTFSEISGANFNPAVSFGLWACGKMSNRKFLSYFVVQVLASALATLFIALVNAGSAKSTIDSLRVSPGIQNSNDWQAHVFFSELGFTFMFVYMIFCNVFENESTEKLNKKKVIDSIRATMAPSSPDFSVTERIQFVSSQGGGSNIPLTIGK